MADTRDNGHTAGKNRPHDPLVVKGHEVFRRAATPCQDHHVDPLLLLNRLDCRHDRLCSVVTLNGGRRKDQLGQGIPAGKHVLDVVPDGTVRRRDDPDDLWCSGQGSLPARFKEALGL